MKFDANATIKKAEEDYGLGKGDYFKVKDGDNKIRLLSPFLPHQSEYNGKTTFKFVAWILDRKDGKVKLYFMPKTIVDEIGVLQANPEYAFEEVPMPYDLTINAENAGTIDVEYKVVAARANTELTPEELKAFEEKPPIAEVVEKLAENQKSSPGAESSATEDSGTSPEGQPVDAREVPDDVVPF